MTTLRCILFIYVLLSCCYLVYTHDVSYYIVESQDSSDSPSVTTLIIDCVLVTDSSDTQIDIYLPEGQELVSSTDPNTNYSLSDSFSVSISLKQFTTLSLSRIGTLLNSVEVVTDGESIWCPQEEDVYCCEHLDMLRTRRLEQSWPHYVWAIDNQNREFELDVDFVSDSQSPQYIHLTSEDHFVEGDISAWASLLDAQDQSLVAKYLAQDTDGEIADAFLVPDSHYFGTQVNQMGMEHQNWLSSVECDQPAGTLTALPTTTAPTDQLSGHRGDRLLGAECTVIGGTLASTDSASSVSYTCSQHRYAVTLALTPAVVSLTDHVGSPRIAAATVVPGVAEALLRVGVCNDAAESPGVFNVTLSGCALSRGGNIEGPGWLELTVQPESCRLFDYALPSTASEAGYCSLVLCQQDGEACITQPIQWQAAEDHVPGSYTAVSSSAGCPAPNHFWRDDPADTAGHCLWACSLDQTYEPSTSEYDGWVGDKGSCTPVDCEEKYAGTRSLWDPLTASCTLTYQDPTLGDLYLYPADTCVERDCGLGEAGEDGSCVCPEGYGRSRQTSPGVWLFCLPWMEELVVEEETPWSALLDGIDLANISDAGKQFLLEQLAPVVAGIIGLYLLFAACRCIRHKRTERRLVRTVHEYGKRVRISMGIKEVDDPVPAPPNPRRWSDLPVLTLSRSLEQRVGSQLTYEVMSGNIKPAEVEEGDVLGLGSPNLVEDVSDSAEDDTHPSDASLLPRPVYTPGPLDSSLSLHDHSPSGSFLNQSLSILDSPSSPRGPRSRQQVSRRRITRINTGGYSREALLGLGGSKAL